MRIETEPGFWLVLGLMILLFPLRFLVGELLAGLVHEVGHLLALLLTGGGVQRILLRPGGVRIETDPMGPGQRALCAFAGPMAGFLTVLAWRRFPELAAAGVVQTLFNLLPIPPLDGFVIWSSLKEFV